MKKQKLSTKKLNPIDHLLYILIYSLFFLCSFSLPFVILIRDNIFLNNNDVLSYSTGLGILWIIPSMCIAAVTIAYFGWSEKKKKSVKEAVTVLFRPKKTMLIVVVCIAIFFVSFSLALCSSRYEFRTDGFYTCNVFDNKKIGDVSSVQMVKWHFDSAYISNGRYGSLQTSLCCEITIDDQKLSFDRFDVSQLLIMVEILREAPAEVVNDYLAEEWLANLDCEDDLREDLYEIFVNNQN